ncbi:MAG: META domain-containing protein [Moraxellaceae bacterium]|nr:META domain-containing protein [Moraxellaceae bacterium]
MAKRGAALAACALCSALLLGCAAAPWRGAIGPAWEMTGFRGEAWQPPAGLLPVRLQLHTNGHRLSGFLACNELSGYYLPEGPQLRLAPDHKSMDCTPARAAFERDLLFALESTQQLRLEADALVLRNAVGIELLRYRRRPPE